MEPFNLGQFKAGRKAITRDGRTAEFLAYDRRPLPTPPKLVPLEAKDIPPVCWLRIAEFRGRNGEIHVVQIHGEFVVAGHDRKISYRVLKDDWEYSADRKNWKPCSKVEEATE